MGAFELNQCDSPSVSSAAMGLDPRRMRDECIIALKVYDSCRQQDCLGPEALGPSRAAECLCFGDERYNEGDVIEPPANAASVTIDRLRIKKILIVDKQPNEFRVGYWTIDLKYVFEYRLNFREADGNVIGAARANSIFNKQVSLFGSVGSDLIIGTDLLCTNHDSVTIDAEPFVLVEAKAISLLAELRFCRPSCPSDQQRPSYVNVTIGLFTIIKLFRIVNLAVESRGFCVPDECEEISPLNPCEFFDGLDFPMDIFAPPQRPEFLAGISSNIKRNGKDKCVCKTK
ncbi:MAG: hypothetical protein LBS62_03545 [Clostridiales bacterium]|jgi:hypothetical protein|nr:hypothetical protein [Clostridiales bacterium]